ncbi:hypothetical protein OIU76_006570 [Salix suchowensis]|nr:hypothetical protein OIU76_006570 [Salix suchowensis]
MSSETEEAQDSNGTSTMSIVLYVVRSLPSHAVKDLHSAGMGNHTESVEPHEFTEALPGENDSKVLLPHQQLLKLTNKLKLKLKKAMPQHCFQPNHARQKKNANFLKLDLKNGLALYCSHTNCLRKQVAVNLLKITNKLRLKLKKAGMLNCSHTQYSRKQITVNQWKLTNKPKKKVEECTTTLHHSTAPASTIPERK